MRKTSLTAIAGIAVALFLTGCAPAEDDTHSLRNIEEARVEKTEAEQTTTEEVADVATGDVTTVEGSTNMVDTSEGVVINGTANVTATDIAASNGVIHVIDAVILPPAVDLATLLDYVKQKMEMYQGLYPW